MRANYGEVSRKFFIENTNPLLLVDFTGTKLFDNATVDTNILLFEKAANLYNTQCCIAKKLNKEELKKLSLHVQKESSTNAFTTSDSWVILSPIEQSIKQKIEKVGTPLNEWDINIYRGVLTGCNDAFIISTGKRDEILANCKTAEERAKTEELIRPILRGRDIKRYGYEWADLWLIYIPWHFPLHLDATIQGNSEKAEKAFQEQYPAVYNHMLFYKKQLSARNKAETGIRYEWYAMQRWGANYLENFFKPKICWASVGETYYSLADKEKFLLDTNYFFAINEPEYLLGVLNSKLVTKWINSEDTPIGEGNAYRHYKYNLEKLPIPKYEGTALQQEIVDLAKQRLNGITVDNLIDELVYSMYGLSLEEIKVVEGV